MISYQASYNFTNKRITSHEQAQSNRQTQSSIWWKAWVYITAINAKGFTMQGRMTKMLRWEPHSCFVGFAQSRTLDMEKKSVSCTATNSQTSSASTAAPSHFMSVTMVTSFTVSLASMTVRRSSLWSRRIVKAVWTVAWAFHSTHRAPSSMHWAVPCAEASS